MKPVDVIPRKGYDSSFNSWVDKKTLYKCVNIFPERISSGGKVKVELDVLNYPTKEDLKNERGVDTSDFAKKNDSTNLRSNVG